MIDTASLSIADYANWQEFSAGALEANRRIAMGIGKDGHIRGGLMLAETVGLAVGTHLSRIAYSSLPARMNISRPWWVMEDVFKSFFGATLKNDPELISLIRNNLALAGDFIISNERADEIRNKYGDEALRTLKNFASIEPLNRVFTVEVTKPLLAFAGKGRDVSDLPGDGALGPIRTWRAAADIVQLFVPGLVDYSTGGLSEIGKASIHFRRSHNLRHFQERILADLMTSEPQTSELPGGAAIR